MSTEEKFHAAVNVIRSLPKNGSYQPSTELMLKFYAYFKQATLGPCKGPRPAFWDVIGRTKYDAWKKLSDMSKHDAMHNYVTELHSIVETMSYNDNVANFLEAQQQLEALPIDDLELIAGDVIERVRSQPNSPFASREASPQRVRSSSLETSPASSISHQDSDHSDDEYIDTIDSPPEYYNATKKHLSSNADSIPNGHIPKERLSRSKTKIIPNSGGIDISQDVLRTIKNLQTDIERLSTKLTTLETKSKVKQTSNHCISFNNISKSLLTFMILWPFVTHTLLRFYYWSRSNHRK